LPSKEQAVADIELAEKSIEAEIVLAASAVVESHALEPDSYGAGYDAGYVAGLR
jgi:hypothetical protein